MKEINNKIEIYLNTAIQSDEVILVNACLKEVYKIILEKIYNSNGNVNFDKSNILNSYKNSNLSFLLEEEINLKAYKYDFNKIIENLNHESINNYFPFSNEKSAIESKALAIELIVNLIECSENLKAYYVKIENNTIKEDKVYTYEDSYEAATIEASYDEDNNIYTTVENLDSDYENNKDCMEPEDFKHFYNNEKSTDNVESHSPIHYGSSISVRIESNPFKQENKFYVNDIPYFKILKKKYRNSDISGLKQEFISDLNNVALEFNASEINIIFEGSKYDFEDLNALVEEFNKNNVKNINLTPGTLIYDLNRVKELKQLRYLIENSDVDAIKDPKMLEYFDMYLEENNSVCVLATMSAGKSTLINALLGNKLMPSKNEACTAKIMHLKNNNESTTFVDEKGNTVSNELLKTINGDSDKDIHIYLEGPIRNFSDVDNFEIIDTPGPNNYRDKSHKQITYNFIKSDKKHMIIVVLDGLKLMTTDEADFISKIAREQGEDGKIDSDRFLFVINKADRFSSDDNEEISMKRDAISMLKSYGIENPKIHLVSAHNGLLSKLEQNNMKISEWEEDELDIIKKRAKRGVYKFHELSDLSPSVKNKINNLIQEYTKNEDYLNLAIATSGILALELTIKEYMNKYKNIRKVKNIVKVCKNTIDKNDLMNDIKSIISSNIKEKEALQKSINCLKGKINNDKKINDLRDEIHSIKFGDSLAPIERSINIEFQKFKKEVDKLPIETVNGKKLVNTRKANECIEKLQNKYEDLRADLISELGKSIKKDVTNVIDNTISKYKKYISSLCEDIKYNKEVSISKFIDASSPDFMTLAKNCVIQETLEKVKTIENPEKKGLFGIFKFWEPKYIDITTYHNKKGMELSNILKFISDAREDLHKLYAQIKETRDNAKQKCIHEINIQINDFNKKIKYDLDRLSDLRSDINEKNNTILEAEKEMKRKIAVIKNIKQKLDNVMLT
ncbi:dynamin family protein [Clostridium sp. D43t1_170807_H7]|uniref:dynamin family protein n=1 Tax=Clostridium sp. D43t1_170807_H7 TaxID=2787140 RepID=UPI001899DB6B|nr:dynamin family protein [Clostridium sp. D43t1_170807_H7]